MASEICLPSRKTNCSFEIHVESDAFILEAMVFVIILYAKLQSEIGLNPSKVFGLSLLGIRARKVAFRAPATLPFFLDSSTASRSSFPKRSKKSRKSFAVQPSGPRLFETVKPFRVASNSERVTGSVSTTLSPSSSENIQGYSFITAS